ncbi:MAG: PmoA family protein [Bryobacteraceae bacterium]
MSLFRNFVWPVSAVLIAVSLRGASVKLDKSKDHVDVEIDGRPFTTYYFGPQTDKPYLMPLRTASGIIVTRAFPVVNDVSAGNPKASAFEPHQRPLYFGHGDIDGLDFWQEQVFDKYYDDHGHQAYGHVKLKTVEQDDASGNSATVRARFTLNSPNNRVIGEEAQSFIFSGDENTRIIDCEFSLYATNGPLDIGDTKEGTFAIRLAPELSAPHDNMLNSQGAKGEKAIWGKPSDWVDYSGTISGKPVNIAVFDSPKSFRHPTTWHARAYGLLAANPFGLREFTKDPNKDGSWTIPEGKSVTFRYRVLIHDGEFDFSEISAAYRRYTDSQ